MTGKERIMFMTRRRWDQESQVRGAAEQRRRE